MIGFKNKLPLTDSALQLIYNSALKRYAAHELFYDNKHRYCWLRDLRSDKMHFNDSNKEFKIYLVAGENFNKINAFFFSQYSRMVFMTSLKIIFGNS